MSELEKVLNSGDHQDLIDAILNFTDESTCVKIALSLDDNYDLDESKSNIQDIEKGIGNVNLREFITSFKSFALKIGWDEFFRYHRIFYSELFGLFSDFPENLDLDDIKMFYGTEAASYNYIPSISMNGGFSHSNKLGNRYYIRGIVWWKEESKFYYDKEYLLECLFHEFSHPIINPIVDKYLSSFENLEKIYDEAVKQGLPKTYSSHNAFLYEYFVRANAFLLVKKYYPDAKLSEWVLSRGFGHLPEVIAFTEANVSNYRDYEEFFKNSMIAFFSDLFENKMKF